jgi:hypothetical protein
MKGLTPNEREIQINVKKLSPKLGNTPPPCATRLETEVKKKIN